MYGFITIITIYLAVVFFSVKKEFYKKKEYRRLLEKYKDKTLCEVLFNNNKLELLYDKYKDIELAKKIFNHIVWIGMSKEILIDSLGEPNVVQQEVLKKNNSILIKETYKYECIGKNRYTTHIFLQDNFVIGWKGNAKF